MDAAKVVAVTMAASERHAQAMHRVLREAARTAHKLDLMIERGQLGSRAEFEALIEACAEYREAWKAYEPVARALRGGPMR